MTASASVAVQSKKFALLALLALTGLAATSAPALACNPFELLFGGCRETQVFKAPEQTFYEAPAPRHASRPDAVSRKPGADERAARVDVIHGGGVYGRQKAIEPTISAPVGSIALFEKDKTLRAGDVVVTTQGFRVYRGGGEFAAISHNGGRLATLENASFKHDSDGRIVATVNPSPLGLRPQARARARAHVAAAGG